MQRLSSVRGSTLLRVPEVDECKTGDIQMVTIAAPKPKQARCRAPFTLTHVHDPPPMKQKPVTGHPMRCVTMSGHERQQRARMIAINLAKDR